MAQSVARLHVGIVHSLAAVLLATAVAADSAGSLGAQGYSGVYNGRAGHITVPIPRLDALPLLDGTLNDPVWQRAALLTGFSEYTPVDGLPADDSTEVLVWYSRTAIYFGIRAFEPHGIVHSKLADRDRIDADDNVQIILSPFLHARQALVFAVNPLGVQEDGAMTEGVRTGRSFNTANTQTGRPSTDLSPDFVYESKGHVSATGYEIVVRVPFRSIKYQSADPQDWGLNILRKVQHSGHEQTWVPTRIAAASFLAQSGTLTGLTGLQRGLVLDLNPFVTERVVGDSAHPKPWRYGVERPAFGGNLRWGITNNLTLTATYRPDFAEVESDATKLQLDPRNAVSYPEKRPFFLEGLEQFSTPNNLIYTRSIEAPIDAAKLTGKLGGFTVAYLGAQDVEDSSVTGAGHSVYNIVRAWRDIGSSSQIGTALTDKEQGGAYNRVASVDARFTFAKIYTLALQGATSVTRDSAGYNGGAGPLFYGRFTRAGRTFGIDYLVRQIDPQFVAGAGFISRVGVGSLSLDHRVTFYGKPGSLVETFGGDFRINDTWAGRALTDLQAPEDRRFQFNTNATLHGGWQLGAAIYVESYGYDPALYRNYYLGKIRGLDTLFVPFGHQLSIANTDYITTLTTPQFAHFNASIAYVWGRDENFYEWSTADVTLPQVALSWQPTQQIRVNGTFNAQLYHRHSDGSTVAYTVIPRLVTEYQLTRAIFFRFVGQYDAQHQDSLRDDSRSNLPIYIRSATTGVITRASAGTNNAFTGSFLFSYQPVPGTVAFIGYSNDSTEPETLRFTGLRRQADSFFIKLSYLFRV
jgi:hypothetical protein